MINSSTCLVLWEHNKSGFPLLFYTLLRTKSPITSFDSQQEHWANVSSVLRFKNNLYCLENAQIWIPDIGHSAADLKGPIHQSKH